MKNTIDKNAVLDRLKLTLGISGKSDFSKELGISASTLSNWYSRKTFDIDIIFTKCEGIDLNWLFNGIDGLKNTDPNNDSEGNAALFVSALADKDTEIKQLYNRIIELTGEVERLKAERGVR